MCMQIETPLGFIKIRETGNGLVSLEFLETEDGRCATLQDPKGLLVDLTDSCLSAGTQLIEYFAGRRREFTVRLNAAGTPFQKKVWEKLLAVPYGRTVSYGELAEAVGCRHAARAVGYAMKANPIPIFIPCHRVVRMDGSIGGYSSGLDRKRFLLSLENNFQDGFSRSRTNAIKRARAGNSDAE